MQLLNRGDVLKDHFDYVLISKFRVNHHVVERPTGPLGAEVVAYEGGTLRVDFGDQLGGFLFGFPDRFYAENFFLSRGVDEDVEGVRMIS